jgi:predicted DNA-binding transcriptional regulator AlpA
VNDTVKHTLPTQWDVRRRRGAPRFEGVGVHVAAAPRSDRAVNATALGRCPRERGRGIAGSQGSTFNRGLERCATAGHGARFIRARRRPRKRLILVMEGTTATTRRAASLVMEGTTASRSGGGSDCTVFVQRQTRAVAEGVTAWVDSRRAARENASSHSRRPEKRRRTSPGLMGNRTGTRKGDAPRRTARNASAWSNSRNVNQGFVMDSVQPAGDCFLLSVREVARRLGIARRTLEREVSRKNFPPPMKIGAKSVYSVSDVETYVAKLKATRDGSE